MRGIFLLAIKDLLRKWPLAFVMALLFCVTFGSYLALMGYKNSLNDSYFQISQDWLIIQKSDGIGEIHGSRLSPDVRARLTEAGYENPIPEIHQIVGTSIATGILMRGVSLADYGDISYFLLDSGVALDTGSPPRSAMVGSILAETNKVKVGGQIRVRGRDFNVVGIFTTKTYQDNEVWISLEDAQKLINYGEDVSIYYIPDGGVLKEGDNLGDGIVIGRKGEMGSALGHEVASFYNYLGMVASFAAVATVVTLTNLLWRLAWLRRYDFGVIRTLGFGRKSLVFYLFVQAITVLTTGLVMGWMLADSVIVGKVDKISSFGVAVATPTWDLGTLLSAAGLFLLILLIGIAYPAIRINQMRITFLLGRD